MTRHRLNVIGPFSVTDECCTLCGVPWGLAPELFDHDERSCWVKKQPATADELERMFEVFAQQEVGCIRYGGADPTIVRRLHQRGDGDQCDFTVDLKPRVATFATSREEVEAAMKRLFGGAMVYGGSLRVVLRLGAVVVIENTSPDRWELSHNGDVRLTERLDIWLVGFARDVRWKMAHDQRSETP